MQLRLFSKTLVSGRSRVRLTNLVVLAIASLLAFLSIALVAALQRRVDTNRDAEVKLERVLTQFNAYQGLPYDADPGQGGSSQDVRRSMRTVEQRIERTLVGLRRDSSLAELADVSTPLSANFATNEEVRVLIARQEQAASDVVSAAAERSQAEVTRVLEVATDRYETRAAAALLQATLGSAGAIVALLAAFALYYRRSIRARLIGEALAGENERLLAATQLQAMTDSLTGLGNRRALMSDLTAQLVDASAEMPLMLTLFDLDGFKQYNDTFGHPAGDALLRRLADRLAITVEGIGSAYRLGGDEFCVLASVPSGDGEAIARLAAAALCEDGSAFDVQSSFGFAFVPNEANSSEAALKLADQRMYALKAAGDRSAARQSTDVLLRVLDERGRGLGEHSGGVARLARLTARALGLEEHEVERVRLAAELHDVGKTAIPDAILSKPTELSEDEWAFMRRHTLIGERIVLAAPSLAHTAVLVRASHERVDGTGYPDQLRGDDIPLGAQIIAVCDAYDAMVRDRPYSRAMSAPDARTELRRCSGSQFDTKVVAAFEAIVESVEPSDATVGASHRGG